LKITKWLPWLTLLIIAIGVRMPGLYSRAIWYDEALTLLVTSGHALPAWPDEPTSTLILKQQFQGAPTLGQIARDAYQTTVHPPFYFWLMSAWRRLLGNSIEVARYFSLLCSAVMVIVVFKLLKSARFEHPFIPSLLIAVSAGTVFAGQEARPYALGTLLVYAAALFAYLAVEMAAIRSRALSYSISMALCCGAAMNTNYLTLFPVAVILLWYLVNMWSHFKVLALGAPAVSVFIWLLGLGPLLTQSGSRSNQAAGFVGVWADFTQLLRSNMGLLWAPAGNKVIGFVFALTMLLLLVASILTIVRSWKTINRKFLQLVVALACVPSIGLLVLDIIFNKNISGQPRYLLFAGPALVILLSYGIYRHLVFKVTGVLVLGLMLSSLNWGWEKQSAWPGSHLRSLAGYIEAHSSQSYIVAIGAGYGRGDAASVVYELDDDIMAAVITITSDVQKMANSILVFPEVWIVPAGDAYTADVEQALQRALQQSGHYGRVEVEQGTVHLWHE
jgi:uncharacterized membrane protein